MLRFVSLFIITAFLSLNFGILLYINSTFLGNFFDEAGISLLFLVTAAFNILLFFLAPRLVGLFGKEKLLFLFLALTFLGTLTLASSATGLVAGMAFIIYETFLFMAYWALDIFVEEESLNRVTGKIRGIYSTIINAGILGGALLLGFLSPDESLLGIYSAASALLILPIFLSLLRLFRKKMTNHHIKLQPLLLPFRAWWHSRNVRAVTLAKLVLETFYAFMVIYTPIYLHSRLGFEWSELSVVFAIALLPFILFEWPAGILADRLWGEKEMMSVGFFFMGMMLITMPFLDSPLWVWTIILFLSRVGAALVEITTESYFFKKVNAAQTGYLSIFRLARPVGLIIGAVVGVITVSIFPFSVIFLFIAFIVLLGLRESLYLKDTL